MTEGAGHDSPGVRGLILAAGYGTRLAPLTDHLPKPLLPVAGKPLLDGIIKRLLTAGVAPIAINSHHLGDIVQTHVAAHEQADQLHSFPEADILGTGGALANARDFLGASGTSRAFVVYNGDVLCDVDLAALIADHHGSGALATLLLADWPAINTVTLGSDGAVRHIGGTGEVPLPGPGDRQLTYAGVGVFDRQVLDDIGPGFSSLIAPLVRAMARKPGSVRGFAPASLAWDDLGTLGRWLQAAGPDAHTTENFQLTRLTGHGSERRFWRLGRGGWSAVAMHSPPGDDEHERFLAVAGFLAKHDLGPARILAVDEPERTVLMEDLGPISLYALATDQTTDAAAVRQGYEQVVDRLLALQAVTPLAEAECPLAMDRVLDLEQLRWETSYFQERFLQGHLGCGAEDLVGLEDEFAALAAAVANLPRVLLHRDFQSQNILFHEHQVRLVDFQGLRLGPLTYDLASLVWDPYVDIPGELRQHLVARFAAGCGQPDPAEVGVMTTIAGLQRVMQALGAYGFLGHVKGKAEFLVHIPAALRNLHQLLTELAQWQRRPDAADCLPGPLPCLTRLIATKAQPESKR
ncbi:MAG: phosphotransferase [Candidatus Krumholzibacteria bacterium]|nr:phosphotransferase [Candidatus Krumholzibacteria bacterium]